jgi:dTDP-4-dehydrorhamnose 3,5-epimerase
MGVMMEFKSLAIPEVILIEPTVFHDERGFFVEKRQKKKFFAAGIFPEFVQDNHSYSKQGVLRGLHYQIQQAQVKLVQAIKGEICTEYYAPEYDRSLMWNDADVGIEWPLVNNQMPDLSPKDAAGASFSSAEYYL